MLIQVTDKGFMWQPPKGRNQVAQELLAITSNQGECLEVVRGGKVIDEAEIRTVGTHGSFECFYGLEKIAAPRSSLQNLEPGLFRVGDELRILNLPANFPEPRYWQELTSGKAIELAT